MSTVLYMKGQINPWVTNDTYLFATTTRGKQGNFSAITTTTVSGTEIEMTMTAGGSLAHWVSPALSAGATVSGTVTVNMRGKESATTVNAGVRCKIYQLSGGVETLIGTGTFGGGTPTELGTTDAAKNFTLTPTSTSFAAGDRIVVKMYAINAGGTMAAGSVTLTYGGGTGGSAGDTSVTFTENLTFNADVEVVDSGATGGNVGGTNGSNVTGNMILVYVSWAPQSVSVTSVTDGTNTYTPIGSKTNWHGSGLSSEWFYAKNITGGGLTITANLSGGTTFSAINVIEFAGADTSGPVDQSTIATGSSTSPAGGSVTTTAAYDLIVGMMDNTTGSGVTANAAGFQPLRNTDGTLNRFVEFKGLISTGSNNTGFTQGSDDWVALTLAVKSAYQPPAGGGTVIPPRTRVLGAANIQVGGMGGMGVTIGGQQMRRAA